MFSLTVRHAPEQMHSTLQLQARLDARTKISPSAFDEIMQLRQATHNVKSYVPCASRGSENLFQGTWFLEGVDDKFRRSYARA